MDIAPKKKVKIRVLVLVYVKTYGVVNNVMFLAPVILVKIVMISVKTVEYPLVKIINVFVVALKGDLEIDVINNVPNKHFVKTSVKMEEYLIMYVIKKNVMNK